jgi:hypothetical protein
MSRRSDLLNDAQWETIGPLLPALKNRGSPWRSNREMFEGILGGTQRWYRRIHQRFDLFASITSLGRNVHLRRLRSNEKEGYDIGKTKAWQGCEAYRSGRRPRFPLGGLLQTVNGLRPSRPRSWR